MTKQISTHAAAAKMIRAELKKHGIKGRVKARSFSMGDAVDIYVKDELPATIKKIKQFSGQFQYGHFDGMQDMYEYSNSRDDIPQVKFVSIHCEHSNEIRQAAWDYVRSYFAGYEDQPADFQEANRADYQNMDIMYRVLNGSWGSFWTSRKPRVKAA